MHFFFSFFFLFFFFIFLPGWVDGVLMLIVGLLELYGPNVVTVGYPCG